MLKNLPRKKEQSRITCNIWNKEVSYEDSSIFDSEDEEIMLGSTSIGDVQSPEEQRQRAFIGGARIDNEKMKSEKDKR
ncbi:hypothetical protein Tco_0092162 [Tanacetum coccineum]